MSNILSLCGHHHRAVHELGFTLERMHDDTVRFRRPDGTLIDPTPPCESLDGCAHHAIRQHNEAHGALIDAKTGIPHWDGHPMDRVQAVEALLQAKGELEYCS